MNQILKVSTIFLVFFVYIPSLGMDEKPQTLGMDEKPQSSLEVFVQAYKQMLPNGKLFCTRDDIENTGKFFDELARRGNLSARDMLTNEGMCKKFAAMNGCMATARKFSLSDLTFDKSSDRKSNSIKCAIALQKMLIQIYFQQFDQKVFPHSGDNAYYDSYRETVEDVMKVECHPDVKQLLTLFEFSFCNGEIEGIFVFQAQSDPFRDFPFQPHKIGRSSFDGLYTFYCMYKDWLQCLVVGDSKDDFEYLIRENPFNCNNKTFDRLIEEPEGPTIDIIQSILASNNCGRKKTTRYIDICKKYGCKTKKEIDKGRNVSSGKMRIQPYDI